MKLIITGLLVSLSSSFAFANDYSCQAKANPNRGFNSDFTVLVTPAAVGGQIIVQVNGQQKSVGPISEVNSLDRNNAADQNAFDLTLGYIGEADVSGIKETDLDKVTVINLFKIEAHGDEVLVFQLFSGTTQIGGTFVASGMGTACLAK